MPLLRARPAALWPLVALGLVLPQVAPAQQSRTGVLHGQVVARVTGNAVRGARIVVDTRDTVAADSVGRFELTLAPARYMLEIGAAGYSPASWRISVHEGKTLEHVFELEPTYQLPGVVVEATPNSNGRRFADFERQRQASSSGATPPVASSPSGLSRLPRDSRRETGSHPRVQGDSGRRHARSP